MSKRERGRKAVEEMLRYGMPAAAINTILGDLPASQFTNGAYKRLIDEQTAKAQTASG